MTPQRTIIGKTTHCVDPSCKGWLVDSFLGERYWIQCLDKKHAVNRNGNRKAGSFGGENQRADHDSIDTTPDSSIGDVSNEYKAKPRQ